MKKFLILLLIVISYSSSAQIQWTADWSADDKFIAFGGDDSLLRIYSSDKFQLYKEYRMPNAVKCVRWHPSSKLLAVSLYAEDTHILDMETGKFSHLPGAKKNGARAIGWNSTGELIAVADASGGIRIWNSKWQLLKYVQKQNPDGTFDPKSFFSVDWHPSENIILTGGDEIRMHDTSGYELKRISHRKEYTALLTVDWHPSGKFFATGDYGHEKEGKPTLLQFWQENGEPLKTFKVSHAEYRNIRWSKDGSRLATASDLLRIHNADGRLLYCSKEQGELLWGLAWNSTGSLLITTSNKNHVRIWNSKAELVKTLQ